MTEYRLFPEGTIPDFTTPEFFASHPWISPAHQVGHAERTQMTAEAVRWLCGSDAVITSIIELGCGDGALYSQIKHVAPHYVGWDACEASVAKAKEAGLDVYLGDIREVDTSGYDLTISCEVIEHMADPHSFVASIQSRYLILTSPFAEDADWHYEHHAWAWDAFGYARMAIEAGWHLLDHRTVDAPPVTFTGGTRNHGFQCLSLERVP